MNKKTSLAIAISLVLCMLLSLTSLSIAQPSDISGNWAEAQITDWVNKGLAHGYPDGTFKPNNNISRAEFVTLTNQAMGYEAAAPTHFSDVSANDWFANEIAKAQAAGYISGYPDGTMAPGKNISRQEMASIIAKIAQLNIPADYSSLTRFKDAGDIPAWSKGAIAAVVSQGFMQGYPDQTFKAEKPLTRAEAIVTLNNAMQASNPVAKPGTVYDKAGTFGPATGVNTIDENVTVSAAGVTLQNLIIAGNLTLAEGIGEGDVHLKNVTVQGKSYIKGGGAHSINLENCKLPDMVVSKAGVRVVASGNTSVSLVQLENGATLLETTTTGSGFEKVTILEIIPAGAQITLTGNFTSVNVAAAQINLAVTGGTIANLEITEKASGAKIALDSGARVNTLSLNAVASVTGQGTIDTAKIGIAGISIEPKPGTTENPNNYPSTIGGTANPGGTGSGTGTGGGGGVSPLNLLSSDPADGSTGVPTSPTIKLTFDRGVVRDHWDTNQNCITMQDNAGQPVSITVFRATNYLNDNEKTRIYVTPNSALTAGTRYTLTISADLKANNDNRLGSTRTISFTVATAPGPGGGGSVNPAAPLFSSASTNNNGSKIKISFNKAMADPAGKHDQFSVSVNGAGKTVTGAALDNADSTVVNLTLDGAVVSGDAITVAYTKGTIAAADGGVLESFVEQNVTNTLVPAAPAAPLFSSASTNNNGTKIKISFNKAMADPAAKHDQFSVSVNGAGKTVTGAALDNADNTVVNLTLDGEVVSGDAITVAYTKGTIAAADGGVLESFVEQNVTNTLTPAAPAAPLFSSASTNNNGTKIKISFNKTMADPAGKHDQFSVSVNGAGKTVTGAALDNADSTVVNLTLDGEVVSGDAITVAYTKGTIAAADGGVLESFVAQNVTNTLVPAAPTYTSAEITTRGDLSIIFDKVMADPAGKHAQFTVKVDDIDNGVTAVQLTTTDGKIKLTLVTKVLTTGHSIIVTYTKGFDESSQVKSTDGGILESFSHTFTN